MPTTRSATRSVATATASAALATTPAAKQPAKRKAKDSPSTPKTKEKKPRNVKLTPAAKAPEVVIDHSRIPSDPGPPPVFVPAQLSFSFEDAKKHLISVDPRFEDLFDRLHCKPFEQLEVVHPFRALATSIIGQQISWIAARAVNHKFVRLYKPELPEKVTDYGEYKSADSFFPSPYQVANTDIAILRSAGLSGRKAEYVQDLASRFSDGRLTTEKLLNATDEELFQMLIAVKGIGPWTVDMFAIFSLRRPNILPVGDLGVQRGVLRWILGLHSKSHNVGISPDKAGRASNAPNEDLDSESENEEERTLPVLNAKRSEDTAQISPSDLSSMLPAPLATPLKPAATEPVLAVPLTPSLQDTLVKIGKKEGFIVPPLPAGLTVSNLRSRLESKKKIKGALLTPTEMEGLTESWKPYRSLGVYYMWSLQ